MAHVQLRRQNSGLRVLPVFYTNNYVSLLPGETKSITVDADAADLHGEIPLLVLDGWNTTVASGHFPDSGGASIGPNKEAKVDPGASRTFTYQHVKAQDGGD
jgi:hypothetical protein